MILLQKMNFSMKILFSLNHLTMKRIALVMLLINYKIALVS